MDWVEALYEKWRLRFKNFSLKKTMMMYLLAAILIMCLAVGATLIFCESWKGMLKSLYQIDENYRYIGEGGFVVYYKDDRTVQIVNGSAVEMKPGDWKLYDALNMWEWICIPVYVIAGVYLVTVFYYKNKLREPIYLLRQEMKAITDNDLSFSCYYDSADEMGDICKTMDAMRKAVLSNWQNMQEMMEEQRRLNAAFAHDLRTPLTVIMGYTDMLSDGCRERQLEEGQVQEAVAAIGEQARRMRSFAETMKELHGFETWEIRKSSHTGSQLEEGLGRMINGYQGENMPVVELSMELLSDSLFYDEDVVMEVFGNLLSNAIRYARHKIRVLAKQREDMLCLYVKDDGRGMTSEELSKAVSPYYSDKRQVENDEGEPHFGLGLTICRMLCKKHGGDLSLSNSIEGGAVVCAEFRM